MVRAAANREFHQWAGVDVEQRAAVGEAADDAHAAAQEQARRTHLVYVSCALWLTLGLINGVGGVVLMAATLMLAVGLVALIVGRARWAFIGNRKVAAIVTGGSLLVGIIGGAAIGDPTSTDDGTDAPAATSTLHPTEPPSPSPTESPPLIRFRARRPATPRPPNPPPYRHPGPPRRLHPSPRPPRLQRS